jgi:hypothetical protein
MFSDAVILHPDKDDKHTRRREHPQCSLPFEFTSDNEMTAKMNTSALLLDGKQTTVGGFLLYN